MVYYFVVEWDKVGVENIYINGRIQSTDWKRKSVKQDLISRETVLWSFLWTSMVLLLLYTFLPAFCDGRRSVKGVGTSIHWQNCENGERHFRFNPVGKQRPYRQDVTWEASNIYVWFGRGAFATVQGKSCGALISSPFDKGTRKAAVYNQSVTQSVCRVSGIIPFHEYIIK
jgi:hypothetical protein